MKRSLLTAIITAAIGTTTPAIFAAPQWIWLSKEGKPNEKVTLKTEFNVPGDVTAATLRLACDDGGTAVINGKQALTNPGWAQPSQADVKALLQKGANTIVLNASNAEGIAGAVATIEIVSGGATMTVETSGTWLAAVEGGSDFKPAVVVANYGDKPWGDALAGDGAKRKAAAGGRVAAADSLQLPKGFKAELLHIVPKGSEGSWVALAVDPKGRLIAGDQYGGLYRVTVPAIGVANPEEGTTVERLETGVAGAHGLIHVFDSLYAVINEKGTRGLSRLRVEGDGFGKPEVLRQMKGGGEHGPHSAVLSPDGKSIFFNGGNHTELPENMELSRAAKAWGEDHILPRLWDGNGHAKGKLAPGGYICKTDPDGKSVELYSYGFRNQFDMAFNASGDLFSYDADMEWDIGTPWYRPTRLSHSVSGAEFGWRSGSGKWPDYYPDMLPPVVDIGPGSPTGVCSGVGAKFPAKYQNAIYALDWTYGTMYAVHLTPEGASYRGEAEEFVSGKPLPLTDAIIHPDGAMYFAIGGRRVQSALYRVTYVGTESTAPAPKAEPTAEARLRVELEKLHENGTGPEAIEKAWPSLGHKDRFVRFAARVAIERQPAKLWTAKALAEKNPQAAIEALIALARVGRSDAAAQTRTKSPYGSSSGPVHTTLPEDAELQMKVIAALSAVDFAKLDIDQRLGLLRAWQLCFTRLGKPAADVCAQVAAKLDPLFPAKDARENSELVQLLVFLDSKTVVAKTVPLLPTTKDSDDDIATEALLARNTGYAAAARAMHASRPNRRAIWFAAALRNATVGWTPELRRSYFAWFPVTRTWKGGNSFPRFIDNIRNEALGNFAPADEKAALNEISSQKSVAPTVAGNVVAPKGPGRAYTVDAIVALAKDGLTGRDFANGKAMYAATLCAACHHFAGEGGNVGPDLTGSGNRYTIRDLAENIVDPSKVISDQYGSEQITKLDGSLIIGRVIADEAGKVTVMTSPLTPDVLTTVPAAEIASRKPWNVSMMPPGLINSLNEDELKNLLAYMLSGGKEDDKAFKK